MSLCLLVGVAVFKHCTENTLFALDHFRVQPSLTGTLIYRLKWQHKDKNTYKPAITFQI